MRLFTLNADNINLINDPEYHIRHGMSNTKLYYIWRQMRERCNSPTNKDYKNYGGRGITVYPFWNDDRLGYLVFLSWALQNGYQEGLTIDRIDNDKGYSPDNCRWIRNEDQARNRRCNVRVSVNGIEYPSIAEASRAYGISPKAVRNRIKHGWSIEDALTIKPKSKTN